MQTFRHKYRVIIHRDTTVENFNLVFRMIKEYYSGVLLNLPTTDHGSLTTDHLPTI